MIKFYEQYNELIIEIFKKFFSIFDYVDMKKAP